MLERSLAMRRTGTLITFVLILTLMFPCRPARCQDGPVNTGQDFTRPVARLEAGFSHLDMEGDAWSESVTVRATLPWTLSGGWKASLSAEQPYTWIKGVSRTNPYGGRVHGFGEATLEALFITPPGEKWTWAFGAQWIPPSASHDELGTGRHQLAPTVGARCDMGGWMPGAWCGALLRHAFDAGGYSGYPSISQTIFQPMLNVDLPGAWFFTLAPEIRYDWENDDWFVPFDFTAGRVFGGNMVARLIYRSAANDDMKLYVNTFEARISCLFDADAKDILSIFGSGR